MTSMTFADLGVSAPVCAALETRGITSPFPVQELVLPAVLDGKDVLAMSPTGSGKTLAFGLGLIDRVRPSDGPPSALILAPTRELAGQIEQELTPLAAAARLRVAVCFGGVGLEGQAKRAARADILVATPGRLNDLIGRNRVSLGRVQSFVLDEADRMLDMGFLPQVERIARHLPTDRQTMLFSATLDAAVGDLATRFTRDPVRLRIREAPGQEDSLAERLAQSFAPCSSSSRVESLVGLIKDESELVLVFCRTKRGAERLAKRLVGAGVRAGAMHGNLTQSARQRAMRDFRAGRPPVLVATDVAARGVDLDGIGLVVNFDPPEDRDAYVHRVGRTARAGRTGRAVTLVSPDQAADVGRIAVGLGLEADWARSGYPAPPPRVVYRGRGRGGGPRSAPRPRVEATAARPRPASRVKRGSRLPA
jgi:ATP-dependent RNA helicase RhlE